MTHVGTYEQHCADYALYGNPERDHWDYEENARYDRFDGFRETFHDEFDPDGEPSLELLNRTLRAVPKKIEG